MSAERRLFRYALGPGGVTIKETLLPDELTPNLFRGPEHSYLIPEDSPGKVIPEQQLGSTLKQAAAAGVEGLVVEAVGPEFRLISVKPFQSPFGAAERTWLSALRKGVEGSAVESKLTPLFTADTMGDVDACIGKLNGSDVNLILFLGAHVMFGSVATATQGDLAISLEIFPRTEEPPEALSAASRDFGRAVVGRLLAVLGREYKESIREFKGAASNDPVLTMPDAVAGALFRHKRYF